ncbi:hypothetical protein JXA84_09665 [candidate division WOR-3 bacterium]|nr:hypothetical protein [candidate division WOR-3 bacterium]
MKLFLTFTLLFSFSLTGIIFAQSGEKYEYYSIRINSREDMDIIRNMGNAFIVSRDGDLLYIEADYTAALKLASSGYRLAKLSQEDIFGKAPEGYYHSWDQVLLEIDSFTSTYPGITKCDTIGFSVQNRPIVRIKISDNPTADELEGRIQFNGCHHGNEKIATEINLYYMRYLCENYGVLGEVTSMVDNREIFIIPVVNPDGFVLNLRRNANNIDLNRDYGYQWFSESGASVPFSEPESRVMRDDFINAGYTVSLSYHSTAQYVNYLWDYSPNNIPDYYEEVDMFSIPYSDSTGYVPIRGNDWYQIAGSCQDATYGLFGILAVTIETLMPTTDPDPECLNNLGAMKMTTKFAGYGIKGYVFDSLTNQPLEAVLFFQKGSDPKWPVNSRVQNGEYQKILSPGSYQVTAHAPGHQSKSLTVQVYSDTSIVQNFYLAPSNSAFGLRMMCARQEYSNFSNTTYSFNALGPSDGVAMSLNRQGYAIIDFGENHRITDVAGYDLKIHEADDGTLDSCLVYAGNSPDYSGAWIYLGKISGTDSFDISSAGITSARYVKILDDGSSTSGTTPGYDLDAVTGINQPLSVEEPELPGVENELSFSLSGNFLGKKLLIVKNQTGETFPVEISISDLSGRIVNRDIYAVETGENLLDLSVLFGRDIVRSGTHFLIIEGDGVFQSFKLVTVK